MFLPNDPSYQDVWLKPQWMTLAYAQALQYWAEEANPLAPSEPRCLAMNVIELRWCIGKYTTFNEHDVFEGLGNALPEAKDTGTPIADSTTFSAMTDIEDTQFSPMETQSADDPIPPLPGYKSEAKDEDTGTPPVDYTASPAMNDVKDTQPSPVETPPADDTIVLAAKPNAWIQKDLAAAPGASSTELEDPVASNTVSVDMLASPPTLASHTVRERQEYPRWIKVHSSQKSATVGSVPYKSRETRWHCNHSSKWCKRVQCLLEEWQELGEIFGSALSKGSPEPVPQDEEGKGADPKGHPWGSRRLLSAWQLEEPQGGGPCLHGCSWDQCGPHTADGASNSNGDLHLHGEGSKNRCCLCVNCDHLDGDHEFGGPLNGGRPPGGYSRGTGRRCGRGPPLMV